MVIDRDELDALSSAANDANAQATGIALEPPRTRTADRQSDLRAVSFDPELARLLRIRVPVIVRLAQRAMPIGDIMRLSPGAIIEFARSAEAELDLMINNSVIGRGTAVRAGDNFGLRITSIRDLRQRIRSLGEPS